MELFGCKDGQSMANSIVPLKAFLAECTLNIGEGGGQKIQRFKRFIILYLYTTI